MVDTIHFTVDDFEVTNTAAVTIRPGNIDNRTGKHYQRILYYPLSTGPRSPVIGEKAFYNGRIVSATIFRMPYQATPMMSVRLTAPLCLRADNYQLVEEKELQAVYLKTEEELSRAGIFCSLTDSKIKRLDLARNILTSEIPLEYIEVLQLLEKAGLENLNWNTTRLLKNTQQEICIYDKIAELRSKGIDTSGYPGNVLRIEQRIKSKKKIKSALDIVSGGDLIKYYSRCQPWYQENLKRCIFQLNPVDSFFPGIINLKSKTKLFSQQYDSQWLNAYIHYRGIEAIIKDYDLKEFCQIIKDCELQGIEQPGKKELHRVNTKLSRLRKNINAAREFRMMITNSQRLKKSYAQLYNELKELVLCA